MARVKFVFQTNTLLLLFLFLSLVSLARSLDAGLESRAGSSGIKRAAGILNTAERERERARQRIVSHHLPFRQTLAVPVNWKNAKSK